ncbi:TPA: hypothetical protein R4229_001039 [Morganella morganii]|nr:hypothetical protein [Morganella morganii]
MEVCYLCGSKFNNNSTVDHGEHVIQQAIGGSLISKGILCKECGGKLSKEIDVPFNRIFEGIATRLNIKTDRKGNKCSSVPGVIVSEKDAYGMNLKDTKVFWKNFMVTPVKPFHRFTEDNKRVIIYASEKQFKNQERIVQREIDNMRLDTPPEVIKCDDVDAMVRYEFPMNNRDFKRGMAKIAIGFACTNGISREKLPLALKISDKGLGLIDDKVGLVQYYPLSIIDLLIERKRSKLANYPSHTLILFTSKQNPSFLWCYIELFSTFQFYVLLNDDYKGEPIYKYHYQKIEKADEYIFTPDRRHYKERNMILGGLGITDERIQEVYDKQNNDKDKKTLFCIEVDLIREEYEKQKYKVNFECDIKNFVDHIASEVMLDNCDDFEYRMNFYKNYLLFRYELNNSDGESEDVFDISSYRRFFSVNDKLGDYPSLLPLVKEKDAKKYSFFKFEQLNKYIENEGIQEKKRRAIKYFNELKDNVKK